MTRTAPARSLALRTVPALAVAAVLLTACGPAAGSTAAAGSAAPSSAARSRPAGFGGVAGPIASVGAGHFTVTETTGTATVDYTATTVFDLTATGTRTDVRTGLCVVVGEAAGSDASTGSVDASSVRISLPVNGSCAGGAAFGRGGFGFPGGGQRPSGAPGRFGGGAGGGGILIGTVASVGGAGFVVTVTSSGGSATAAAGTTTAVTVSGATTYTVTTKAAASDLTVGQCARVSTGFGPRAASGSAAPGSTARPTGAPTGPVTAASVTLSAPVNGSCADAGPRFGAGRTSGSTGAGA
ncbi:MAG: hypothetical protein ACXVXS_19585 [Blastococcus sp.]